MLRALVLALLVSGCAATPRDNAHNLCTFVTLASFKAMGLVGAAACSFGLELIPNEKPKEKPDARVD